ncbi:MAG: hypothetical protein SGILL_000046 [Bacillariaceae sp.]
MNSNNVMNQIPSNIMKAHDPNDDPFGALSDDQTNQLTNPMEYGSGLSFFVQSADKKEEHSEATEESTSEEDAPAAGAADDSKPVPTDKGEADKEVEGKKEE